MAFAVQTRSATGTIVSRKAEVAPISRAAVRPFTAQRPVAVSSGVSACEVARSSVVVRASAAPAAPSSSAQKSTTQEWYALVCNAEWFFMDPQNESIAEQLRERVRFFKEQGREGDFYIVPEPAWLEAKYPAQAKQVRRPCVALVSTDKQWITFMKLRLDRVLKIELGAVPDSEALASAGSLPDFKPSGKWTAPYARYTPGWWNVFLPKH